MLAKRIFDIVCSFIGLLILSPVFLIIIVLIKTGSKGPVFFRQTRIGQYEKPFQIHKFRTMIVNAEARGLKITVGVDPRVTSIGRFLRKSKLDELPQLIDVLIGNMSLVGPRPEVPDYVRHFPPKVKAVVFRVKPGITDWASLKMIDENEILAKAENPENAYINEILPEKLAYAVKYVKTRTMATDIYLIFLTVFKIFAR